MPDGFLIGVFLTAILLVLGVYLGYGAGRKTALGLATTNPELEPILSQLRRIANNFSYDFSAYRSLIATASQQAKELNEQTPVNQVTTAINSDLLLKQILEANDLLQRRLVEAETNLQSQASQLNTYMTEARTDLLTGVSNRRAFDEQLAQRLAIFHRQKMSGGVLLLDVDHFKSVNDKHGHAAGDQVLKQIGAALQRTVRETDEAARYGGEEFGVVLAGSSPEEFSKAVERIRKALGQIEVKCETGLLKPTVSCGVTQFQEGDDSATVLRRADAALYAAKADGRNCTFWHDGTKPYRILIQAQGRNTQESLNQSEHFREICTELRRKMLELKK